MMGSASLRPRIIVLGNEKGGSGKSTTALHVIVALLRRGLAVGSLDLDARQGTLSRALANREAYGAGRGMSLPMPLHQALHPSRAELRSAARVEEEQRLSTVLGQFAGQDFVVIDTPGSDTHLSRLAHTYADVLVTPLNDSFLDLDLLARIDPEGQKIVGPSVYSQMVWEQRQQRARAGARPIDWVVLRNRLAHIDARNKRDIERLLNQLAPRIGFRVAPGFGERVIFRELFPKGLTLFDLRDEGMDVKLTMSPLSARQEVHGLLRSLGLEEETPEAHPDERASGEARQAALL